tara:strand:- start:2726 stop:3583 length:858 start_codon:yes stop_codon:yes gene_type:complete
VKALKHWIADRYSAIFSPARPAGNSLPEAYRDNLRFAHLKVQDPENLSSEASKHLAVFVHIPKAGGTSMKNLLLFNYARLYQDHHPRLNNLRESIGNIGDIRALSAHAPMGYEKSLIDEYSALVPAGGTFDIRDTKILRFSITRDPVDRLVSTYNFVRTFPAHALHQRARDLDPDDFFALLASERPREFSNLQCFFLSGADPTFVAARESMERNFAKVVDISAQSKLIDYLVQSLGLNRPPGDLPRNASPNQIRRDDLTPKTLEQLLAANQEDLRLADFVQARDA